MTKNSSIAEGRVFFPLVIMEVGNIDGTIHLLEWAEDNGVQIERWEQGMMPASVGGLVAPSRPVNMRPVTIVYASTDTREHFCAVFGFAYLKAHFPKIAEFMKNVLECKRKGET